VGSAKKEIRMFDSLTAPLDGTMLIEAGAGTGKTYAITSLVVRLVAEIGLEIDRVLVVTFTRAATRELKDRIRRRISEARAFLAGETAGDNFLTALAEHLPDKEKAVARLEAALAEFDCAAIYTIDGFCQRVLRENAFESGALFDVEMVEDQSDLVSEAVWDFWRSNFYGLSPALALSLVDEAKIKMADLLVLARQVAENPSLRIEPDQVSMFDFSEELDLTIDALRDNFRAEATDVRDFVTGEATNKGRKYHKPYFADSYRQFGEKLLRGHSFSPGDEMFTLLAESTVSRATKKGHQVPNYQTFEISEHIKTISERAEEYALGFQLRLAEFVRTRLPEIKAEYNVSSYSDFLVKLRDALRGAGGETLARAIRAKYGAALIDEFQDTDPVQYEIFGTIFSAATARMFLIGDPKQAIYGFRGADIFAYLKASDEAKNKFTLGENWRSEPELIGAVNALFENGADRRAPFVFPEIEFEAARPADNDRRKKLVTQSGSNAPLQLWFVDPQNFSESALDKRKNPPRIKTGDATDYLSLTTAQEIRKLLDAPVYLLDDEGEKIHRDNPDDERLNRYRLQEKDIAVLVRKNAQAPALKQALAAVGVGAVVYGEGNVYQTDEAGELAVVLAAAAEPGRERAVRAALAGGLVQTSAGELVADAEDDATWERALGEFREYHRLWSERGFYTMFRRFMEQRRVTEKLLGQVDGERKLTNLQHLAELLHRRETEQRCNVSNLLQWFAEQRRPGGGETARQLRLESDENLVNIITMHKSKGLEFPVVFCPFLWQPVNSRQALYHRDDQRVLDLGGPDYETAKSEAEREALAEDMRLIYVALTRAKNRCYFAWGKINDAEKSALAYLLHPDEKPKMIAALTAQEARQELQQAFADCEAIQISSPVLEILPPREKKEQIAEKLECRVFGKNGERVRQGKRIASFTLLKNSETKAAEEPDHDRQAASASIVIADDSVAEEPQGIFKFPRGAAAGNFFHDLLENMQFDNSDDWDTLIDGKLTEHGYQSQDWSATVRGAVERLLTAQLSDGERTFSLQQLGLQDRLTEMEFVYPVAAQDPKLLARAFAEDATQDTRYPGFGAMIERVRLGDNFGWMKGFIDLVFQSGGKYYLLDWKTNHLGNSTADYARPALEAEMAHSMYILQYYIYLVALNRYLQARLPGYDYDKHFGGVYYLFLRGISAEENEQTGIYFDRPTKQLVERLDHMLKGNSGEK
jgi:exodeoxyribonuclease V beta subunit